MRSWNDTIIALATPPGVGAIGVIRLSGPQAVEMVNGSFPAKDLAQQPSHTLHVGWLMHNGTRIDEVVISLYRAPRSYTGEDVVEISAHGSPYVLQRIIDLFVHNGVRLARPGEFTLRAFLNSKMDLAQAEAVADLIASQSEAAHRTSLHQMRGGFSKTLADLREQLIQFGALIELELDFATEDVEFADREKLIGLLKTLQRHVGELLVSFKLGNVIRQGVQVAIIGKPNAGKSTLLNQLLNENRAIVSEIAGTTRDTIEEVLNIDGILFRLIDTAGIREHAQDTIEVIGIEKSLEKMEQADLVLYVFDVQTESPFDLMETTRWIKDTGKHYLMVGNKADMMPPDSEGTAIDILPISAKTGAGINLLKEKMVAWVLSGRQLQEDGIVTNARHYQALLEVDRSLADIEAGIQENRPGDLLALDIRRCLHYLGEITGQITNEDQLDHIFSKFCIGK
ncbi:MAG TPA: tRNA uridine-5-carboxymethylaminomethyl(34) synthesis GTPase MnmE [Phnomibacter sp.]|nr:tRNA uridine-5-carboxymethylaminomethyl(34) synthesis GTPase MnmE [Phnomibacter sp.]